MLKTGKLPGNAHFPASSKVSLVTTEELLLGDKTLETEEFKTNRVREFYFYAGLVQRGVLVLAPTPEAYEGWLSSPQFQVGLETLSAMIRAGPNRSSRLRPILPGSSSAANGPRVGVYRLGHLAARAWWVCLLRLSGRGRPTQWPWSRVLHQRRKV